MAVKEDYLQPSLLDRLIDDEQTPVEGPVHYRRIGVKQIKEWLIRDIENLLNTRRSLLLASKESEELDNSLLAYGIPDYSAENPASPFVKRNLRREIEQAILKFEPRLKNVAVRLSEQQDNTRALQFRISGVLDVQPLLEPVEFDTYFDAKRCEYIVKE